MCRDKLFPFFLIDYLFFLQQVLNQLETLFFKMTYLLLKDRALSLTKHILNAHESNRGL